MIRKQQQLLPRNSYCLNESSISEGILLPPFDWEQPSLAAVCVCVCVYCKYACACALTTPQCLHV